jgi:membrane-associated phospholipid phosphatase
MCLLGQMDRAAWADSSFEPEPKPASLRWDPQWGHRNGWDYSLAAVGATGLVVEGLVFEPIRPPLRWRDPIFFDSDVRDGLRLADPGTRQTLESVSWVLWGAQLAWPVLIDVPLMWAEGHAPLARDLFWQDAATLTVAGAADMAIRDLVGRARPYVSDCLAHGGTGCLSGVESTRSFPGGHIVNSTAASVLLCTQHAYVHIYGGPWDAVACAASLASNTAIAYLRIASDNHWATDQLAGLAMGALIGWGVPYVVHFHHRSSSASGSKQDTSGRDALVIALPAPLDHGGALTIAGAY